MGGSRSTLIETQRRVFTIQGWIVNGVPDYLILKNIQKEFNDGKGNPIGLRQAKNLRAKAYEVWHQSEEATIDQKRTLRIAELKQDIRNMRPEFKGTPAGMTVVNNIKKEISKLESLYPTPKLMLQGDKDNPVLGKDPLEIKDRIAELIALRDKK